MHCLILGGWFVFFFFYSLLNYKANEAYKMILNEFRKGCKACFMGRLLIFNRNLTTPHTNNSIKCFVSGQEGKQAADSYDSQIYSQPWKIDIHPNAASKA